MTDPTLDLGPQALIVARLVAGVTERQLDDVTPCPAYAVHHMLGHIGGLAVAFRDAGRKNLGARTDTSPDTAVPDIAPDWRGTLPKALDELVEVWRDPAAWEGRPERAG
ncbi:maleylpyruvate isomerase N-terminal domain-containing protein [Streptomyces kaempferi]